LKTETRKKTMITEQQINAAHAEATAQRGPRKGRLKATCPPMGTLAAAYWQGVMFEVNPLKVSIARMIFMSVDEREMFDLAQAGAKAMMKKRA
jgi:hypothetical protein